MKILGIDFSSSRRSVALFDDEDGRTAALAELTEEGTRETHAFDMITRVLNGAGVGRSEVDAIAVGLGPGSYGGMRVALAIAQGWQIATGIRTSGVPSSEVLAEIARKRGCRGELNVVTDAQRREFHLARYQLNDNEAQIIRRITVVSRSELVDSIKTGTPHIGPDTASEVEGVEAVYPGAGVLAEIAARRALFVSADQLQPVYVRATTFAKAPMPRTDL